MVKIYVGGRNQIKAGIEKAIKSLEKAGFEITFDWTKHPSFVYKDEPDKARDYSVLELDAIEAADAFVLISDEAGTGMYVEMGYALGKGKPIFVVGKWNTRPMFMFHPAVTKCKTIRDVIVKLKDKKF